MKQKKFAILAGLLGLGGLAAAGAIAYQKAQEKRRQEVIEQVRHFFAPFGTIKVVYVNDFEATDRQVTGGVVFDDDVTFYFTYDNGDINYRMEAS